MAQLHRGNWKSGKQPIKKGGEIGAVICPKGPLGGEKRGGILAPHKGGNPFYPGGPQEKPPKKKRGATQIRGKGKEAPKKKGGGPHSTKRSPLGRGGHKKAPFKRGP